MSKSGSVEAALTVASEKNGMTQLLPNREAVLDSTRLPATKGECESGEVGTAGGTYIETGVGHEPVSHLWRSAIRRGGEP
ncbi:hypothetical protein NRB_15820 [Novosphingobium sp. 11B]